MFVPRTLTFNNLFTQVQISESVWFRDAILNTFAELGDPEANFLRDLYSDSVNERERYNEPRDRTLISDRYKLSEILLNCDLMKDMYFPGKPWYQQQFSSNQSGTNLMK